MADAPDDGLAMVGPSRAGAKGVMVLAMQAYNRYACVEVACKGLKKSFLFHGARVVFDFLAMLRLDRLALFLHAQPAAALGSSA